MWGHDTIITQDVGFFHYTDILLQNSGEKRVMLMIGVDISKDAGHGNGAVYVL
jgi:hypothetical protein